ncbi:MAG: hypothetical protein PHR45_09360, partial [Muribaculaceae bacterium]|nr:hypothetical protein [Muribaculaceae bacterium]
IKIAGEDSSGERCTVSEEEQRQFTAYMQEIKDAGVRINIVNKAADWYSCEIDIYYDPMRESSHLEALCKTAIKKYIENLPFDGEYTNMSLIDALQEISGVDIAELKRAESGESGTTARVGINARCIPVAGYFAVDKITINMIAHG